MDPNLVDRSRSVSSIVEFVGGSEGGEQGFPGQPDLPFASPLSISASSSSRQHLLHPSTARWANYDQREFDRRRWSNRADEAESIGGGEGDRLAVAVEREHMFDKVVTPSDVGKLNRLVIPKQHAEKYFPLDSSSSDKGLLLNFEDRAGKSWRFRYSYWNSSQSYVMTKGWSRFVKDKKLDAGDIVSFHRASLHKDRLFIDWRRRPFHPPPPSAAPHFSWSPLLLRPPPANQPLHYYLNHHHHQQQIGNYHPYRYGYGAVVGGARYPQPAASRAEAVVFESVPVVQTGGGGGKKLRLFGVNMECSSGDELEDGDVLGSSPIAMEHAINVSGTSQLSSSSHPHLQLKLYNGTPLHLHHPNNHNKGKAISDSNSNSMSLDLDM